jgi:biotin carboxyl carrier protein
MVHTMKSRFTLDGGGEPRALAVEETSAGAYTITVGEEILVIDARRVGAEEYHILHGHAGYTVVVERKDLSQPPVVHCDGTSVAVSLVDERQAARQALASGGRAGTRSADGTISVRAPMPGKVVKALVKPGEPVTAGMGVIVVEAMKMENELRSPSDGTVKKILVCEGENVEAGATLVLIE